MTVGFMKYHIIPNRGIPNAINTGDGSWLRVYDIRDLDVGSQDVSPTSQDPENCPFQEEGDLPTTKW